MRLTLRTLLAYIDNILDPKDQEELAQKVNASDVAHDLLHRTRDVTHRLRLPAPPLDSSGPYSDPNMMAEYLDNVLPPDDVPHFERRCLELEEFPDADSYLAEAANCHHVLTMVLGQRAEIDPELKQQLYALADKANHSAPQVAHETAAPPPPLEPHSPEVPDYLRASERPLLLRLSPAIAALALFGATLWFALGPGGWLRGEPEISQNQAQQLGPEQPPQLVPDEQPAPADPEDLQPEDSLTEGPLADDSDAEQPANGASEMDTPPPVENGAGLPAELLEPNGASEAESSAESAVDETPAGEPAGLPPLDSDTPTNIDGSNGAGEMANVPSDPIEQDSADSAGESLTNEPESLAVDSESGEMDSQDAGGTESEDQEPLLGAVDPDTPEEPEPPKRLGLTEGISQVLLRRQEDGTWRRLSRRSEVMPGDTLLSAPTYRPSLLLDSGVLLDLVDGSRIETSLLGESTPAISITYGRAVLTNTSSQQHELAFAVGELSGRLTLQPGALLAVDIQRRFQPGIDPRSQTTPLTGECYAPQGGVEWVGDSFAVQAGRMQTWQINSGVVDQPVALDVAPPWIGELQLSTVDKEASPAVADYLTTDEPIWSQLTALSKSKRKEERALASIISVHVGRFDGLIQALRDDEQNLSWGSEIRALRFAMSSSTDLAKAVYQELATQHRAEVANDLFEMLCGYSAEDVGLTPEEWRLGAMRKLIDCLESDQLDYRVLANYNLEQITGRRGVFNPSGLSTSRKRDIRKLRDRLEKGELSPRGLLPLED